jgi:hypothetical protein
MRILRPSNIVDWVNYSDWLEVVSEPQRDWTTIARYDPIDPQDYDFEQYPAMLSYLQRINKNLDGVLSSEQWDVHYDFGQIHIARGRGGIRCVDSNMEKDKAPLVLYRGAVANHPSEWQLSPAFEQYFDLRLDSPGEYVDPLTGEVIVKLSWPADAGPVEMRTDYLRDYLAARKMSLIRQHDIRRYWKEILQDIPESGGSSELLKLPAGCYWYKYRNTQDLWGRYSMLMGKDVIRPFKKAGQVGRHKLISSNCREFPEFIVGSSSEGMDQLARPSRESFDELHIAHFSPKVLFKYYGESSRYTVSFGSPGLGSLKFLDKWKLTLGRNSEGLLFTWLGDFVKSGMPLDDVLHWRANNVPPRGGISQEFYDTQIMGRFTTSTSTEAKLLRCKHVLVEYFLVHNQLPYDGYRGPDRYVERLLRTPLVEEHKEFQDALIIMSRIFIEYLNPRWLFDQLPDEKRLDSSLNKLAPIALFCNWLQFNLNVNQSTVGSLKAALHTLQMARSKSGAAHRFSDSGYNELITRLELSVNSKGIEVFEAIANRVSSAFEELVVSLGCEEKLWWLRPPS